MQKHLAIACMRFLFVLLKVVSQGFHFNKMHKNVKVICKPQGYGTKEFKDMLIMYKRNLIFQKTCITNNLSRMPLSGTKMSLRLFCIFPWESYRNGNFVPNRSEYFHMQKKN